MQIIPYDSISAVRYARRWALGRNPLYYNFDGIGGDCTNFISQCIFAGSGIMNNQGSYGWYYHSLSDRTASWSGVEYLYDFLISNRNVGPYGHPASWNELIPGDLIQLGRVNGDYYHSLMVLETYPEILVAAHTDDALNRPLASYHYERIRLLHIDGVRIW